MENRSFINKKAKCNQQSRKPSMMPTNMHKLEIFSRVSVQRSDFEFSDISNAFLLFFMFS